MFKHFTKSIYFDRILFEKLCRIEAREQINFQHHRIIIEHFTKSIYFDNQTSLITQYTRQEENEGNVFALILDGDLDLKEADLGRSRNWTTAGDGRRPELEYGRWLGFGRRWRTTVMAPGST